MNKLAHTLNLTQALTGLTHALTSCHGDDINQAITNAFKVGLCADFVPSFVALLGFQHHHSHADIVQGLQQCKDPRAVEAIYQAALTQYDYLAYDEFFGLARKCTWALADIGTPEAHAKLQLLTAAKNPLIARYAQKRIDRWEAELGRKAYT